MDGADSLARVVDRHRDSSDKPARACHRGVCRAGAFPFRAAACGTAICRAASPAADRGNRVGNERPGAAPVDRRRLDKQVPAATAEAPPAEAPPAEAPPAEAPPAEAPPAEAPPAEARRAEARPAEAATVGVSRSPMAPAWAAELVAVERPAPPGMTPGRSAWRQTRAQRQAG